MHVSSQFTVGIHSLMVVAFFDEERITSAMVARSIGCNPVIVRNVFSKLSKAGLLNPGRGNSRTELAKPAEEITLRDIFLATEEVQDGSIFHIYPANLKCPVGGEIHDILGSRFDSAMGAMLDDLGRTTLAELVAELPQEKRILPDELREHLSNLRRGPRLPATALPRRVCAGLYPSSEITPQRYRHEEHSQDR